MKLDKVRKLSDPWDQLRCWQKRLYKRGYAMYGHGILT